MSMMGTCKKCGSDQIYIFEHASRITNFGPGGFEFSQPGEMTTVLESVIVSCETCGEEREVWVWWGNRRRWKRKAALSEAVRSAKFWHREYELAADVHPYSASAVRDHAYRAEKAEAALQELSHCVLNGWTEPAFVRGPLHARAVEIARFDLAIPGDIL